MKLNTKDFRYLSSEDWRVLTAVEIGTKNHEVVPTTLITQLSGLRSGSNGARKSISTLAKANLIAKVKNAKYDGYRLTYGGLDYLALHAHTNSSSIIHLGSQMGVGKESDIYLVTSPAVPLTGHPNNRRNLASTVDITPITSILKIHRLGRTSFRTVTRNRAYHGNRQHCSWQYLSRLSAQKEFAAMKALYEAGFPVPKPIAWNRHTVVMSLVPGMPLRQVPSRAFGNEGSEEQAEGISRFYGECMEMTLRLAEVGCIHGDYNEFNLLVENVPELDEEGIEANEDDKPSIPNPQTTTPRKPLRLHLIDFPQITSLSHQNAPTYFARDITCIKTFFHKKYHFTSTAPDPTFEDALARLQAAEKERARRGLADRAIEEQQTIEEQTGDDAASIAGTEFTTTTTKTKTKTKTKKWQPVKRLDVEIQAAGFSKKMARELEGYYELEIQTSEDPSTFVTEGEDDDFYDDEEEEKDVISAEEEQHYTQADEDDVVPNLPDGKPADLTLANLQGLQQMNGLEWKMGTMSVVSTMTSRNSRPKGVAGWAI